MKSKSRRLVRGLEVLVLSLASLAVACAGAGSEKPVTAAAADVEPEADEAPPEEVVSDPQTAAILRSVRQDAERVSEEEEERLAADAELLTPLVDLYRQALLGGDGSLPGGSGLLVVTSGLLLLLGWSTYRRLKPTFVDEI